MVSEVRAEINFSKYLKISQSILDKCINALGVYSEEDLQIRKEILNSINEIWAIFNGKYFYLYLLNRFFFFFFFFFLKEIVA